MKRQKWLAMLIAVAMVCVMLPVTALAAEVDATRGYQGEELPQGPDMSGSVIEVTPENAQYTLDGAYGSINGKTIKFMQGEYPDVFVLARATKFAGSNTEYFNSGDTTTPVSIEELAANAVTYKRTIENVTFTAEPGVVLPGFTASSGHEYSSANGIVYDYVRDWEVVGTGNSYYSNDSQKNVTFKDLTIKGGVFIADYSPDAVNSDITFDGCNFQGDKTGMQTNGYNGIKMNADNKYFSNITVTDCTFTDYFQAVYIQGVDGATIANNSINGTTHNAIALQSSTANKSKGSVTIKENFIENTKDRAIRLGDVTESFSLNAENNIMVNSGDATGELFKATTLPEGCQIVLEHNYWNGQDMDTAIANATVRPKATGIIGGSFKQEVIADYCAEGVVPVQKDDGTFTACGHTALELTEANPATCTEDGNSAYWYCEGCGKYFSDADCTTEIALTDTVIKATGVHSYVDGKCTVCGAADPDYVPAEPTPTPDPTDTPDPAPTPAPTDNPNTEVPKTGDNSNTMLWGILLLAAGTGIAGVVLYGRKRVAKH